MRKSFAIIGFTLAFAVAASAQDVPKMEAFLGYNFVRFSGGSHSFNANGGNGQFAYNFTKNISGVIDLGAVTKDGIDDTHANVTVANYLFGPRFSMWHDRWRPFAQLLVGGAYSAASIRQEVVPVILDANGNPVVIDPNLVVRTRLSRNQNAFAFTVGGGVDYRLNKHFSLRPVSLEYYMTRFDDFRRLGNDSHQNNLRYSAGVNFTFGAR